MSYIPFPDISPDLFRTEVFGITIALRWYALAYIAGLMAGWKIMSRLVSRPQLWPQGAPMVPDQVERLLTWVILGVVIGGRAGYVLFYEPAHFFANPGLIPQVWTGGMSFHGGFLGVVLAGIIFCRRESIPMLSAADLMAVVAPIGIGLGRIANFINAELWGRQTDLPWGVAFPGEAAQACASLTTVCARHPSQLYEALLEGVLLGIVLFYAALRRGWFAHPGRLTGLFVAGYGLARFAVEFVRQPDAQFVTPGNPLGLRFQIDGFGLTMGQALSIPMIAVGLWLMARAWQAAHDPAR